MLHEEATACVAVPQSLWLLCAYDPRERLEKPAFLYLCLLSSISSSKVGVQEGAEGFTPKSMPLEPKSGIFRREEKGNTYATSAHFPCFLQNRSNCKTVLYSRDPPTDHRSLSSNGYCDHSLSHRKTKCVFFKLWGSNLSQFLRIQFKGVRLELLAPMCKRENKLPAPSFYWRRPSLLPMGV